MRPYFKNGEGGTLFDKITVVSVVVYTVNELSDELNIEFSGFSVIVRGVFSPDPSEGIRNQKNESV